MKLECLSQGGFETSLAYPQSYNIRVIWFAKIPPSFLRICAPRNVAATSTGEVWRQVRAAGTGIAANIWDQPRQNIDKFIGRLLVLVLVLVSPALLSLRAVPASLLHHPWVCLCLWGVVQCRCCLASTQRPVTKHQRSYNFVPCSRSNDIRRQKTWLSDRTTIKRTFLVIWKLQNKWT